MVLNLPNYDKTLGQIAYEAYGNRVGWRSLYSAKDIPQWNRVNLTIQDAWEATAKEIAEELYKRYIQAHL